MVLKSSEIDSALSRDIVKYLRNKKKKLKEIGELTGLSESFISRVARGERTFRIEHLVQIERNLGRPLPLLLLEATELESLSGKLPELYKSLRTLLECSANLRGVLQD